MVGKYENVDAYLTKNYYNVQWKLINQQNEQYLSKRTV